MTAITLRMNVAIPGAVTRSFPGQVISQEVIDPVTPPTKYGQVVKLVSGKVTPLAATDAASLIYGITVRTFPTQDATGAASAYGAGTPPTSGIIDVMKLGYIGVALAAGTAARNAPVNVRNTVSGGHAVGDIEDASIGSGTVLPTNWYFTGPADANGNVELAIGLPA